MTDLVRPRWEYTLIDGKPFEFLECIIRFERTKYQGPAWHEDGSCKRVAIAPLSPEGASIYRQAFFVERTGHGHTYAIGDAHIFTDTDGEDWIETELGFTCPRCTEIERPNFRLMEKPGINPFTDEQFWLVELGSPDAFQVANMLRVNPPSNVVFTAPAVNPDVKRKSS